MILEKAFQVWVEKYINTVGQMIAVSVLIGRPNIEFQKSLGISFLLYLFLAVLKYVTAKSQVPRHRIPDVRQ